jgi:hypothetical protein
MTLDLLKRSEKGAPLNSAEFDANLAAIEVEVNAKINATEKGAANGVATLCSDGTIPKEQIDDKALLAATAREIGGTAYQTLLGIIPPTLDLKAWDYQAESNGAPSIANFARASTAYGFNPIGTLVSFGNDVIRHSFDPVTGEYKGWVIAESRTNLLTYSEDFDNAAWLKIAASVASDILSENSATALHYISQSVTFSNSTTYSYGVVVEPNGRDRMELTIGGGGEFIVGLFDLTGLTCDITGVAAWTGASCNIQSIGEGKVLCSITGTSDSSVASNSVTVRLHNGTTSTYTGDGVSGVKLYWSQLEAGSSLSSYIPTTTAAATRAADILSVSTSDFAYNQNEGTLYVEFSLDAIAPFGNVIAEFWEDANNRWLLFVTATGLIQMICRTDGSTVAQTTLGSVVVGETHRAAFSVKQNEFKGCLDGGTVYTDTSGALPDSITRLDIGNYANVSGFLNGKLPHLCYFPRAAGDAVQLLTI